MAIGRTVLIIIVIFMLIGILFLSNRSVKDYGVFQVSYSKEAEKYEKEVSNAANKWSEYIDCDEELKINVSVVKTSKDVIAYAKSDIKNGKVVGGSIYISNKHLPFLFSSRVNVLLHEFGHVLGIGTHPKWSVTAYELDTKNLPNTQESFNKLQSSLGCKSHFEKIPLETKAGQGSAKSHWDTNDRANYENKEKSHGLRNEVMRYKMDGGKYYISELTTAFLKDIGFTIKKHDAYDNKRSYFDGFFMEKEYKCGTCCN